jgi:hypothetical protein
MSVRSVSRVFHQSEFDVKMVMKLVPHPDAYLQSPRIPLCKSSLNPPFIANSLMHSSVKLIPNTVPSMLIYSICG